VTSKVKAPKERQSASEKQARGARAEMLQKELQTVCDELEKDVLATFRRSELHDIEGHRACRYYIAVLEDFKARMNYYIETGKTADRDPYLTLN